MSIPSEEERYVLFLDVLGFSELVLKNPHDLLVRICDSELRQTALVSTMQSALIAGNAAVMQIGVQTTHTGAVHDVQQDQIQLHLMSDSLIAWTRDLEPNSFILLVNFAAMYLANTLILGLPHRGAIARGSIKVLDLPLNGRPQSTAVGSGLVKAHRFEGGQEWMGCIIDPEIIDALPQDLVTSWSSHSGSTLSKCVVPFKTDCRFVSDFAVDWRGAFKTFGLGGTVEYFREQFGRYEKSIIPSVETKLQNTFSFYAAMG